MAKLPLLWVVELNQKTGALTVHTLAAVINRNTATFFKGGSLDYALLWVADTGKECQEVIERLKAKDKSILDLQKMIPPKEPKIH